MTPSNFILWLRAFREDSRGSVSLEFILAIPMLFWALGAMFVFFDGYRQSSVNLKAAYTIADVISRETEVIDDDYIDSMRKLHRLLTRANSPTTLRVTVVMWNESNQRYSREWSEARGTGIAPLTNADILALADRLPNMSDGEVVILVETTNTFQPALKVGLSDIELDNFVFTSPRFGPQVCWEPSC